MAELLFVAIVGFIVLSMWFCYKSDFKAGPGGGDGDDNIRPSAWS